MPFFALSGGAKRLTLVKKGTFMAFYRLRPCFPLFFDQFRHRTPYPP